ncbi:hypothetical protein AAF712_014573, partial [Marasmius tenuissimus]
IVQDIIKHFEKNISTDAQGSPPKPIRLHKFVLYKLRRKLEREFKKAVGPHKSSLCRWEDVLVLIGVVASNISVVPVLAPLQPVGSVLEQIGELVKECAELICRATNILAELSRAMQMCPDLELLDGVKRDIVAFERALIHIRDYVSQLQRESRLKTLGRVVFASKTKEDLEDLRKELECAQMVFMTSNICAIRVGVHAIAVQTATDGDELPPAQGGKGTNETRQHFAPPTFVDPFSSK